MSRLIYGIHPVEEAFGRRQGTLQGLFISKNAPRLGPLIAQAESLKIPIQRCMPQELDALCGSSSHQGIVAMLGEYPYVDLEDLLAHPEPPPFLVVLDSVTDPQNFGAIIRSALVFGATGMVIPKDRAAPITPTVVRVSAGASEHLPCARVTNLARALEQMQKAGLWVAGTVEKGGQLPEQVDLKGPLALVLGNEQKGIRPLVQKNCDIQLTIPSRSALASLNVAAAAAVLLYEVFRQRLAIEKR